MTSSSFTPRWASPPGDTIRHAIAERSMTSGELAAALELSLDATQALLAGDELLTIDLADRLTATVGGSVAFWVTRDVQYREDLARVAADRWSQHLPVDEMSDFGWIPASTTWTGRIQHCLEFFAVPDVEEWDRRQRSQALRTRFRSSQTLDADDYAVAAWLRRCDVELSEVHCRPWNRETFAALLPSLVGLSNVRDPREFLPALVAQCADVGVAVGVVRAPKGCPISGAARRLPTGQPSIALTARHRSDDHLWFTFFHEAAHLVLHDQNTAFLDEIEPGAQLTPFPEEAQADEFAGRLLVPEHYEQDVAAASRDPIRLRRLAHDVGVSMGVLVGHLQHRGLVSYRSRLNRLKHRFVWNGSTLEKA